MGVEGNLGARNVFGDWLPRTASPRKPRKRFTTYEIKHWPKELTKRDECGTLDVKTEEPLGRAER